MGIISKLLGTGIKSMAKKKKGFKAASDSGDAKAAATKLAKESNKLDKLRQELTQAIKDGNKFKMDSLKARIAEMQKVVDKQPKKTPPTPVMPKQMRPQPLTTTPTKRQKFKL